VVTSPEVEVIERLMVYDIDDFFSDFGGFLGHLGGFLSFGGGWRVSGMTWVFRSFLVF
jgi:hypothetical protein